MTFFRKYANYRPRKSNKKAKYARKRQSSNVIKSRSLYTRYHQPSTLTSSTEYPVRQMYFLKAITFSTAFQDGLVGFQLNDLPAPTDFTALYDEYRVDKLAVHFINCSQETAQFSLTPGDPGHLLTAVDFDGGATGLTALQLYQYESLEVQAPSRDKIVTIKPRAEVNSTDATATVVSASLAGPNTFWDCSNTRIQHNGVRYGLTPITSGTPAATINVWVEVFLTFRTTR